MKKIMLALALLIGVAAFGVSEAYAQNPNSQNTVAYYEDGVHAIPLDPIIWLEGYDLVQASGNSGNFIQWYWNEDYGYQSVWNVSKNGRCNNGVLFDDPYPEWGDYLVPNADYCVITNYFSS